MNAATAQMEESRTSWSNTLLVQPPVILMDAVSAPFRGAQCNPPQQVRHVPHLVNRGTTKTYTL